MVAKKDGVKLLQGVPLFSGLSQKDLGKLWDRTRIVEHRPDHEIVTEGRTGQGFHLIVDGQVMVRRKNKRLTLGPGEFFGEMSLIDDGPRSASVVAVGPVSTASITAWEFKSVINDKPELVWKLLLYMTARLREEQTLTANLIA